MEEKKELEEIKANYIWLEHLAAKFKSIRRAAKRGHITFMGSIVAKRPFNNRKNTCKRKGKNSRVVTVQKKRDYERAKAG